MDQFQALAAQVQKNAAAIDRAIWHIGRGRLVAPAAPSSSPVTPGAAAAAAAAAAGPSAAAAAGPQGAGAEPGAPTQHVEAAAAGEAEAGAVPDLQEFYEDCEQHRQQVGVWGACWYAGVAAGERCACWSSCSPPTLPAMGVRRAGLPLPRLPHASPTLGPVCPKVVAGLVARYRSIPPLLVKLEELVAGTSTGKAPRLAG